MSTMTKNFEELIVDETNRLKKEVTCPICLDLYTQPISLTTCQHTFCLECFKGLSSSSNTKVPNVCPVCRKTTNRRSCYMNEHFIETIKLLQMYNKLVKSLDEGSDKDDNVIYDRVNRMKKFLDDCMEYQNQGIEECVSISSISDESIGEFKYLLDDCKFKIKEKNNRSIVSKPKVSKSPIRKTKSLTCTKIKGKYPKKRQKKSTENIDQINIDEYDSPSICELAEEKKIVELLEDDCIKKFENECQNTKNKEEIQTEQVVNKKDEKTNQKQRKKPESILNRKSGESSSSKRTATSTGWSRMKTMKKQIIKKQHKYKQLNVSTEVNKSKSKSTQENNSKLVDLTRGSKPIVVLNRFDCYSDGNVNKNYITKDADTSIKIENTSTDKDLQVQCMKNELSVNKNQEDEDVFSIPTQKLQNPTIQVQNISDTDNISNFIIDAQVHHSSSPVEILPKKEEIIIERHSSKQVKENICVIEEIKKSVESAKVTKRKIDEKKSSEESDDIISATERTPDCKKQLGVLRSSLRSATKRNSNENIPIIENKTPAKRRRTIRQTTKEDTIEPTIVDQNVLKEQSNSALNEEQNIKETLSKDINLMKNGNEEQNFIKNTDFIKNKLKSFSENESTVMSALQSSLNAINVIRSNCSSYVNSESLFSDSWPSKNNKSPSINIENDGKLNLPPHQYHSLPLQTNSGTFVEFYATAIPCLNKIEDFYNQLISKSQEFANETKNFTNTFRNSNEHDNVIVCYKSKLTENVETQTDNITCPNCSYIIDFNSRNKIKSLENTTVVSGFNELNDIDNVSKHFSEDNCSAKSKSKTDISKEAKSNLTSVPNTSTVSKDASQKSSELELFKTKKVNRQLTFSEESSNSQRRKFKRIRSPTPDSDSESVKSKKCNRNYSKLLYRDDIDIFFESDPSEKNYDLSLGSRTNDKYLQKLYNKTINSINKDKNTINNAEDTTSKYVSFLEREYKDAQFDSSKPEQPKEKQNFDTAPNTVLDNLLGSINLSVFENDNFEPDNNKKSQLPNASEIEKKNTQNSVAEALSASMFFAENEIRKLPDVDKTKCIEKIQLETVNLSAENTEDKELNKEVENLTNHDLVVDDSFGSDKDIFGDVNIVESTPQRTTGSKMKRSKFEFPEEIPPPLFDIIEPPATATQNLDWYDIAPPPPPEFQDTEKVEEPKSAINISSITPDIFALNHLDKGFFANSTLLSGNTTNQTITELPPKNVTKEFAELDVIPNSTTQEKEVIKKQENLTPNNKTIIPSNPDSKIWKTAKRNLNPIVLAQKEKFSPLQIIVSQNSSPKPVISSTPKHQMSIMSYVKTVQTSQKEKNVNQSNKNVSRSSTPVKQNINKANTFLPIQENLEIEVCESPVPQNNNPSSSFMKENKFSNDSNTKINSSLLEKSRFKTCIACSRVKKDEVIATITLTQKLGAKYNRDFDKNVTHLVVTVDDRNRIKDHTMKYVLAIAHSVWIISFAWVRDSLQHNRLLPEEPYEVLDVCGTPGPRISRLTRLSNPLFKNFLICCIDPFTSVNRTDIENAVISLGGEIRKLPGDLTIEAGKNCLILAEAKETQDFDQYQVWRDTLNVLVVDIEWLSRTIGQYQITSIRPYILCLEKGINELGYPFALIAPVPETPSQMTMTNTNH